MNDPDFVRKLNKHWGPFYDKENFIYYVIISYTY